MQLIGMACRDRAQCRGPSKERSRARVRRRHDRRASQSLVTKDQNSPDTLRPVLNRPAFK